MPVRQLESLPDGKVFSFRDGQNSLLVRQFPIFWWGDAVLLDDAKRRKVVVQGALLALKTGLERAIAP